MPIGYSRSPKLLKGALVILNNGFIGPIPNIILFQYYPETLSRELMSSGISLKSSETEKQDERRTQPFNPSEKFTLQLVLDTAGALEEPDINPVAAISGVADRISAMEMLLYPER